MSVLLVNSLSVWVDTFTFKRTDVSFNNLKFPLFQKKSTFLRDKTLSASRMYIVKSLQEKARGFKKMNRKSFCQPNLGNSPQSRDSWGLPLTEYTWALLLLQAKKSYVVLDVSRHVFKLLEACELIMFTQRSFLKAILSAAKKVPILSVLWLELWCRYEHYRLQFIKWSSCWLTKEKWFRCLHS